MFFNSETPEPFKEEVPVKSYSITDWDLRGGFGTAGSISGLGL